MKKILAIACILCMTFATLTAFAAPSVTTITTYDYETALTTATAPMEITTTVAGLEETAEITYYVAKGDGEIVFIDQKTATAGENLVFNFVADTDDVLVATAKNGSDKGYTFPTFSFKPGINFLSAGAPNVDKVTDNWGKAADASYGENAYIFQGKVSGSGAEYGLKIGEEFFTAKGCDEEGNFAIVIQGIDEATASNAVPYPVAK